MKAINMHNKAQYEVYTKNGVYYILIGEHIIILDERVNIDTVEHGHLYSVYKIGDEYWTGYYTNTLDVIDDDEQLSLF